METPVQPKQLVLASLSSRRRELLREAGYQFQTVEPAVHEPGAAWRHVSAVQYAESLAFFKASSVAEDFPQATILGADTIAVVGEEIIGKPSDRADARRILRLLSGTTHQVITGVALLHPASGDRAIRHDVSTLRVRAIPDAELEAYIDTGAWEGKAGAYGVQDHGDQFVECIDGSFTNVVGLPLELLDRMFREWRH